MKLWQIVKFCQFDAGHRSGDDQAIAAGSDRHRAHYYSHCKPRRLIHALGNCGSVGTLGQAVKRCASADSSVHHLVAMTWA